MARGPAANLAAAKDRRKKKIAIVGLVLFIAVLAIQVPKTLKMMGGNSGSPTAEPSATTTPTATTAAATPASPGAPETASSDQLVSFERFERKDPFRPQVSEEINTSAPVPAKRARGAKSEKPKQASKPAPGRVPAERPKQRATTLPGGSKGRGEPARATVTGAVISINGGPGETIEVGAAFPAAQKLFRLVSLDARGAKIGVADGSLVGPAKTVTLELGKTLTLMNTADGARYRMRLLSVG
jgi:hypothetical protein